MQIAASGRKVSLIGLFGSRNTPGDVAIPLSREVSNAGFVHCDGCQVVVVGTIDFGRTGLSQAHAFHGSLSFWPP